MAITSRSASASCEANVDRLPIREILFAGSMRDVVLKVAKGQRYAALGLRCFVEEGQTEQGLTVNLENAFNQVDRSYLPTASSRSVQSRSRAKEELCKETPWDRLLFANPSLRYAGGWEESSNTKCHMDRTPHESHQAHLFVASS